MAIFWWGKYGKMMMIEHEILGHPLFRQTHLDWMTEINQSLWLFFEEISGKW
jgi:hypothetical protein